MDRLGANILGNPHVLVTKGTYRCSDGEEEPVLITAQETPVFLSDALLPLFLSFQNVLRNRQFPAAERGLKNVSPLVSARAPNKCHRKEMTEEVPGALISVGLCRAGQPLHSTRPTDPDTQGSLFSLSSASVSPPISAQPHGCFQGARAGS